MKKLKTNDVYLFIQLRSRLNKVFVSGHRCADNASVVEQRRHNDLCLRLEMLFIFIELLRRAAANNDEVGGEETIDFTEILVDTFGPLSP